MDACRGLARWLVRSLDDFFASKKTKVGVELRMGTTVPVQDRRAVW